MTWHAPITWHIDQLVTETDLNEQLRDNMTYLKERVDAPAFGLYHIQETVDYTVLNYAFVDVDPVKLALTLNTQGGDVLVGFFGTVYAPNTADANVYFDVAVNGIRRGGSEGIILVSMKNGSGLPLLNSPVAFTLWVTGLPVGTYTFKLQWKTNGQTVGLRSGGGGLGIFSQFWAREMS